MPAPIHVSVTLTSTASPFAVWLAFGSVPRWPEFITDLIEARIEPDGKLVQGAVIRCQARPNTGAVDMRYDVAEAEPARRLVLVSNLKGLHARTRYVFEGTGSGTRVTVTSEMQAKSLIGHVVLALWRTHYSAQLAATLQTRTQALLNFAEGIEGG